MRKNKRINFKKETKGQSYLYVLLAEKIRQYTFKLNKHEIEGDWDKYHYLLEIITDLRSILHAIHKDEN